MKTQLKSDFEASIFYEQAKTRLVTVRTESELRACKADLDGFEYEALPEHAQTHLAMLFSEAYFRCTGALF